MTVLQFTLLFAAPVSACCGKSDHAATKSDRAVARIDEGDVECCPPGSHPPGHCPLHRNRGSKSERASACRVRCDAPHGPEFLLGMIGVIAAPSSTHVNLTVNPLPAPAPSVLAERPTRPDAPPPKLLSHLP